MAGKVKLTMAVAEHPHTSAIRSGALPIEGIDPEIITIKPQIGAFRRMVRELEFDICEIAPTTYIIARAYGAPFIALPIFLVRRFHHSGLLVRPDAGIKHPKDLEGKKAGVRAYSVTTGVWTRQVLIEEFGVDDSKITWFVDDEEHVRELKLPQNVKHVPEGRTLADMMAAGDIVAGFDAAAGIGRTGAPTGGWQEVQANYPDLLPNAVELEADYYRRTAIYPLHGTIVVKDSVLTEHPWVAKSLFAAFKQAKDEWVARLHAGQASGSGAEKYAALCKIVGRDPLPYGIEENRATLEALARTAFDQKLTPRRMTLDELFVDPAKL